MGTEIIQTEFNTAQYDSAYPPGIEHHYWNRARNAVIAGVIEKHGLGKMKMLEVGCGRGLVVQNLRGRGYECYGADLAEVSAPEGLLEYVRTGTDFGDLEETFRESIEVVLLLDVIEHIPDAKAFLERIRSAFPQAQYLVVTVPARMELWSNYDEHYGHVVRYSWESLERVEGEAGYRTRYVSYFFHLLYIPAVLLALVKMSRGVTVRAPHGFAKFLHKVISWIFIAEQKIVPGAVPGTSLVSVAKRSDFPGV